MDGNLHNGKLSCEKIHGMIINYNFSNAVFCFATRKLAVYDEWSSVTIHVAMDNTVITEDISKLNFQIIARIMMYY